MSEPTAIWRSPRSLWLKASAAAVRSYDPIRAAIWHELALELEQQEVRAYATNHRDGSRPTRSRAEGGRV